MRGNGETGKPFAELQAAGLLWLINRVVFHPQGYALTFHCEADGSVTGWSMQGDGTEPWSFTAADDDECFARAGAFFAEHDKAMESETSE